MDLKVSRERYGNQAVRKARIRWRVVKGDRRNVHNVSFGDGPGEPAAEIST